MTVEAYAKVNLTLEVFGKRPDGFHALRSVVLPIGLSDTLTFEPADSFSTDTGYPDDLILRAATALSSRCGGIAPFRISVAKRIPAGGGLGGGSADAAATLLALNAACRLDLTPEELASVGAQVGSDVPALVLAQHYRRPVLMQGRGETVETMEAAPALDLVMVFPGVFSSTPEVFGKCASRVTDDPSILYNIRTALIRPLADAPCVASAMMNDLQNPAVALHPEIGTAIAALREAGAVGAMMSGSGSTVFGLVPGESAGREIVGLLNARGLTACHVRSLVP